MPGACPGPGCVCAEGLACVSTASSCRSTCSWLTSVCSARVTGCAGWGQEGYLLLKMGNNNGQNPSGECSVAEPGRGRSGPAACRHL